MHYLLLHSRFDTVFPEYHWYSKRSIPIPKATLSLNGTLAEVVLFELLIFSGLIGYVMG